MVAGFAGIAERKEILVVGGLQPSELFSPAVQDGTDSAFSVASMEGQGSGLLSR
jgi:hypothetical protein